MPATGEICQVSGIYKVLNHEVKHPRQITMVKGKQFPPCPTCNIKVSYQLEQETKH